MNKDDISLALGYQNKFSLELADITNDLCGLRKNFERMDSKLAFIRQVNTVRRERVIFLERQYWSNSLLQL